MTEIQPTGGGRRALLWLLVACNVVLAVMLSVRLFGENQAFAAARRPSDYLMIPGRIPGQNNGVVYIVDTSNGLLGAGIYDENRRTINKMDAIDLNRVFQAGGGVVQPGRN